MDSVMHRVDSILQDGQISYAEVEAMMKERQKGPCGADGRWLRWVLVWFEQTRRVLWSWKLLNRLVQR
jgi:hypothetical protein